ncbi:MAG: hydrogenase [Candidatus Magnetomorum sp.]|nr:hydrogenase [Candidatus Magnetomorum sp.]
MMHTADMILALVLVSVLFCLCSSRMLILVKWIVFQGIAISLVQVFFHQQAGVENIVFAMIMLSIRGILIPLFIYIAVKKIAIKREIEPIVGYHASLFAGLLMMVFAAFIGKKFNLHSIGSNPFLIPTAITTLMAGMFLVMTRRKAITMVIGYIMMENGIYLVGMSLTKHTHYIVEFGILLDVLVGVMLMGIILNNINKTFDDIDTTLLRSLKD